MGIGSPPLLFGPIAPESNPPINPQYYQPSVFTISDINLGSLTTITTSVNHNYVVGQNTRLLIPVPYGSTQLNEQEALVISIPAANQVVLALNSSNVSAFIASPFYGPTPPQIVAVGDQNSGQINGAGRSVQGTYIPGSFIDISPL
jgi:hypothetical protein